MALPSWLPWVFGVAAAKALSSPAAAARPITNAPKPPPFQSMPGPVWVHPMGTTQTPTVLLTQASTSDAFGASLKGTANPAAKRTVTGANRFAGSTSSSVGVDATEAAAGAAIYGAAKQRFYVQLLLFMAQLSRGYQAGQATLGIGIPAVLKGFTQIVKALVTWNFGGVPQAITGIADGLEKARSYAGAENLTPPVDPQGASSTGYTAASFRDGSGANDVAGSQAQVILKDLDAWIKHLNTKFTPDVVDATIEAARRLYLAGPGQADWIVFINTVRKAQDTVLPGAYESTPLIYPTGESVFGVAVPIPGDAGFWPGFPGLPANGAINDQSPAPPPRTWPTYTPTTTIPDSINGGKHALLPGPPVPWGFQNSSSITAAPNTLGISAPLMVSLTTGASQNTAPYGETNSYPVRYWAVDTTSTQNAMYWG